MKKTSLDLQKLTARSTVPGAPKELKSIKLTHRGCIACPVTGRYVIPFGPILTKETDDVT